MENCLKENYSNGQLFEVIIIRNELAAENETTKSQLAAIPNLL